MRSEKKIKKDNLRMLGIPQGGDPRFQKDDICARAVTEALNGVAGPKRWTTDDIARVHRVGQIRNGKPKPMIVEFNRWKDKMTILPTNISGTITRIKV